MILAGVLSISAMAMASQVFYFYIAQTNVGYNSGTYQKVINTDHAFFRINGSGNADAWTNFLVVKSMNGMQMTEAHNVKNSNGADQTPAYLPQYINENASTILRVNNGSQYFGYYIYGDWNPNG